MNRYIVNIIKYALFALPAISIVVADSMYFPFITGKNFLFRIAIELVIFLYLALVLVDKSFYPRWSKLTITFIAFTLMVFVADIFALNPARAIWSNFERMEGFVMIAHLLAYFIVLSSVFKEKKDWMIMLFSSIGVSVFMALFGLLQFFGGAVINQSSTRLDGTLGNSAYMATFVVFHLFFILYVWASNGNRLKGIGDSVVYGSLFFIIYYLRSIAVNDPFFNYSFAGGMLLFAALVLIVKVFCIRFISSFAKYEGIFTASLYSCLIALNLFVLYYTSTRGAMIGLLVGIFVSMVFIALSSKSGQMLRKVSIGILTAIVLGVLLFVVFRNSNFIQTSPVLSRFANISLNDPTQARAIIWPMALKAFKENPILGWGQDNFIYAFAKYYTPEMIRHEPWFDRTHNSFLDWLVASGVFGFLGYVLLYVFGIINIIKNALINNTEKAVLVGLFVAYAIQSMFIFDNLMSYIFFVLLLAFTNLKASGEVIKRETKTDVTWGILATFIIMFLLTAYFVNYKAYRQNIVLAEGLSEQEGGVLVNLSKLSQAVHLSRLGEMEGIEQMQRVSQGVFGTDRVNQNDKSVFANKTFEDIKYVLSKNPNDVRLLIMQGMFLIDVGLYDEALVSLNAARDLSPLKQQIQYLIAQAYFGKGIKDKKFNDEGLLVLKRTAELTPNIDAPRIIYMTGLVVSGYYKEAFAVLNTMENSVSNIESRIINTLAQNGFAKEIVDLHIKAIEKDPKNINLYSRLVNVYVAIKERQNTLYWLNKIIEVSPNDKESIEQVIANIDDLLK